jgi:hypothetical protein
MSYYGIDNLIKYTKTINVDVSQKEKNLNNTFIKYLNVGFKNTNVYSKNEHGTFEKIHKTINVKNVLTPPDSGKVNLAFATIHVKESLSYNTLPENVTAIKTINVKYENSNQHVQNNNISLINSNAFIIVKTDNTEMVSNLSYEKENIPIYFYKNAAIINNEVEYDFSDDDIWS